MQYTTYLHYSSFYQQTSLTILYCYSSSDDNPLRFIWIRFRSYFTTKVIVWSYSTTKTHCFTIQSRTTMAIHSWRHRSRPTCQSNSVSILHCINYGMHATCRPGTSRPGCQSKFCLYSFTVWRIGCRTARVPVCFARRAGRRRRAASD